MVKHLFLNSRVGFGGHPDAIIECSGLYELNNYLQ